MFLLRRCSCQTKSLPSCANRIPFIRIRKGVRDPLFLSGSPFFDPRDLVQVKYELLRRVRVDGYSVAQATSLFALSRPTFYAAHAAWEQAGIAGLLPQPTGPRHAHKLTEELIVQLRPLAKTMSAPQLAE